MTIDTSSPILRFNKLAHYYNLHNDSEPLTNISLLIEAVREASESYSYGKAPQFTKLLLDSYIAMFKTCLTQTMVPEAYEEDIDNFTDILLRDGDLDELVQDSEKARVFACICVARTVLAYDWSSMNEEHRMFDIVELWFGKKLSEEEMYTPGVIVDTIYGKGAWDLYGDAQEPAFNTHIRFYNTGLSPLRKDVADIPMEIPVTVI